MRNAIEEINVSTGLTNSKRAEFAVKIHQNISFKKNKCFRWLLASGKLKEVSMGHKLSEIT